jgi:Zn-dependent protease
MIEFRIFGIAVTIEPYFWVTAAFLNLATISLGAEGIPLFAAWLFAVLVTVLWHELGHALGYKLLGLKPEIVIHGLGGATTAPAARTLPRMQAIGIALAGCVFGFILFGVLFGLLYAGVIPPIDSLPTGGKLILSNLLAINLLWTLVNLIPLYPLDGGHVLFALLGQRRRRLALLITIGVGLICCALAGVLGGYYALLFAILMTYQNHQRLKETPR